MDTSVTPLTILCYGDSNTYGQQPDMKARFDQAIRWPRVLQQLLPDSYVIEEGLGGRLTNLDHPDPLKVSKNGWLYFPPCLASHNPDLAIIMLGTNDAQRYYHRSAADIAAAVFTYVDYCLEHGATPLVVAPVRPNPARLFDETIVPRELWNFNDQSVDVLNALPTVLAELAAQRNITFFDANSCAALGADGLHWTAESHQAFAAELAKLITTLPLAKSI